MAGSRAHVPVLLEETLDALAIRADGTYVDATFGRGGHARALLARLGPTGRLLASDRDPAALTVGAVLALEDARFQIRSGELSALATTFADVDRIDGVMMDLGVSSPQLDDAARGFSFGADGPLDMRMDPRREPSLAQWLDGVDAETLADTIHELGEERYARRIARAILAARAAGALTGTAALADVVAKAHPRWPRDQHPATRTFLALRLRINGELDEVRSGLAQALELLAVGARLAVISFHSLEDRIVKQFIAGESGAAPLDRRLARLPVQTRPPVRLRRVGKPVRAGAAELARNPRSRSAILRVAERLAGSDRTPGAAS